MLGGPVPFRHCRKSGTEMLPCGRLAECWGGKFDLEAFVSENYTEAEIETAFGRPRKSRLETIFETLEKSKNSSE